MKIDVKGIDTAIKSLKAAAMEALNMEKAAIAEALAKQKAEKLDSIKEIKEKIQKVNEGKVNGSWTEGYFDTMNKLV
jgi:flavin-dependent dehydrogenase